MGRMILQVRRLASQISAAIFGLCMLALSVPAQSLQIVAPVEGTLVKPGQTVTVTVLASSGAALSDVLVLGEDPIEACEVQNGPPFWCSIQIPTDIDPGSYNLTASAVTTSGITFDSNPISIDVERPDNPTSVVSQPSSLHLWVGDQTTLRVIGTYSDGSIVDLTQSTQTTYASQSSSVVTIGPGSFVTAVGPGSTQIVIDGSLMVPVTVDPPISIMPSQATVAASQSRQFVARVTTIPSNPNVIWSIDPPARGSVDADGVYTAPASISSQQMVTLTATSVADPTQTATATITLSPTASVSIVPGWKTLYPSQTLQFTAATSNVGNGGLVWSISPFERRKHQRHGTLHCACFQNLAPKRYCNSSEYHESCDFCDGADLVISPAISTPCGSFGSESYAGRIDFFGG